MQSTENLTTSTVPEKESTKKWSRSVPKNVMNDTGQKGRLLHNEQCAPFYGSVPFAKTPNLHAGSSQAEMSKEWRLRCSLFPSLRLLAFLVFLLSDWWEACVISAAVCGGAPGPPEAGTGRGCLPPPTAALEVTRLEPWNERRNTRKTLLFPNETSTRQ
jgi:hypothetical protein